MNVNQINYKLNEAANAQTEPERALLCREVLQDAVDYIYEQAAVHKPKNATLLEMIDSPTVTGYINDADTINTMHYTRILGMNAKHGRSIRKKEAKLSLDNASYLVGLLTAMENGTVSSYKKPPYMSEETTRRLYIDLYLKEAGWDVLDKENIAQPARAGIEIEVQGMPNAHGVGYCDYVLYGRDGKPLAIVEVKKTSVSPEKGRHQVDLYGECMEKVYGYRPVLYYTNGYTTRVIDGLYPDRTVIAFHTLEELELMIQRRSRGDITDLKVNDDITNRPYQKMAITNIAEWLNSKHRRGLLVLATGTGKTRISISLVDILTRNNWVKNVLFLADRTTLVHQAKTEFGKQMPNMSICELSGSGDKDYNARLIFCTYQTMINYIDAEDKRFSSGRFDLIIIDEAHRSIFNRYGTIFTYFDSMLIGLTATPKNEVDANTYRIFGCEAGMPNFDYSLDQAVKEHYLVGYHVINRTSKLLSEGIRYADLTVDEKQQLDKYLLEDPEDDLTISGSKLYKELFNKDTCRQVCNELMRWGLRVDGGETMGKTIIFAYNHKHAQMIVDTFYELYPAYGDRYCQVVDYQTKYGDNLVDKFKEEADFRIAVSVDMMDTGVDVPSVLNLVFFKPVHSRIKFVQMIGRGTRLCEDVYGPGKNKSGFQIFDYCGNFEYFGEHPDGRAGKEILTTSQRLFNVRLDILNELQRLEYQEDDWFHAYYDALKTELHGAVVTVKSNAFRIQVREAMQYVDKYYDYASWTALSPVMVKEIKNYVTPLIDSGLNGDHLAVSFDVRMYNIERAILKDGNLNAAAQDVKVVRKAAQYLLENKASVPQVLEKAKDLKRLKGDPLWNDPQVTELERLRASCRTVMPFMKDNTRPPIDIDIRDEVSEADYNAEDTVIDIRTYREKVIDYLAEHSDSPVIQKIRNLEPINNADLDELERILWHELGTQEEYTESTDIQNLAVFVRSLIGLSQEAVNEKFGQYLNDNVLNAQQQEFVNTIISYVRENGDVELTDLVNTEPFNEYDINEIFGINIQAIVTIVNTLHNSVQVA